MTGYESKKAMAQDKITDEQGRPMTYWGGKAQPAQDLSEQGRNRSAVLGNNVEAMMDAGLPFLKALETTLKVYDHDVPKLGCVNHDCDKCKAQPEQEPDWKGLVLAHNAECDERCDKERCGYAPYFEANGRRCPTCPVYEKIDVDTPPQRTWVGLTEKDFSAINQSCLTKLQAAISAESILKEKNNGT